MNYEVVRNERIEERRPDRADSFPPRVDMGRCPRRHVLPGMPYSKRSKEGGRRAKSNPSTAGWSEGGYLCPKSQDNHRKGKPEQTR